MSLIEKTINIIFPSRCIFCDCTVDFRLKDCVCNECAKEIIQCGIKEIIYLSDKYADLDIFIAAKKMFDECGVTYRKLEKKFQKTITLNLDNE